MAGPAYSESVSLCPQCLRRIPAVRYQFGRDVYLKKHCADHGDYQTIVWRGNPPYATWTRPKIPWRPPNPQSPEDKGCPFDCGLCSEHRQQTCTALIEVTSRCDLGCPFCFAGAGDHDGPDPDMSNITSRLESLAATGIDCNIQLSGGEPTMRDDLPDITSLAVSMGFRFVQLNTNGIRLGGDPSFTEKLKAAGLSSVFLQFDGVTEDIHRAMRGTPLQEAKTAAIEACEKNGIGVVLVPTVAPGVNDRALGEIVRFGLKRLPTVRGVHFQPVSYFGRYPKPPSDADRITIPEIIRALEEQTNGLVKVGDFGPPGCENPRCSFSGTFTLMPDGELKSFSHRMDSCSCGTVKAEDGAEWARKYVAKQWRGTDCGSSDPAPDDSLSLGYWDVILERSRTHSFSISGMAFQDAWTAEIDRLKDCCIHVVASDGRLIPFCAYNLTNVSGRSLYRGRDHG